MAGTMESTVTICGGSKLLTPCNYLRLLQMETQRSCETSVDFYLALRRQIPNIGFFYDHVCVVVKIKSPKCCMVKRALFYLRTKYSLYRRFSRSNGRSIYIYNGPKILMRIKKLLPPLQTAFSLWWVRMVVVVDSAWSKSRSFRGCSCSKQEQQQKKDVCGDRSSNFRVSSEPPDSSTQESD
jgi:hypothetical protein